MRIKLARLRSWPGVFSRVQTGVLGRGQNFRTLGLVKRRENCENSKGESLTTPSSFSTHRPRFIARFDCESDPTTKRYVLLWPSDACVGFWARRFWAVSLAPWGEHVKIAQTMPAMGPLRSHRVVISSGKLGFRLFVSLLRYAPRYISSGRPTARNLRIARPPRIRSASRLAQQSFFPFYVIVRH